MASPPWGGSCKQMKAESRLRLRRVRTTVKTGPAGEEGRGRLRACADEPHARAGGRSGPPSGGCEARGGGRAGGRAGARPAGGGGPRDGTAAASGGGGGGNRAGDEPRGRDLQRRRQRHRRARRRAESRGAMERKRWECPALPQGWEREEVPRRSGLSAGHRDVFYYR